MKTPRLNLKEKERAKKRLLFLIIITSIFWIYFLSQSAKAFYTQKETLSSPVIAIEEEIAKELEKKGIKAKITEIKSDMIILKLANGNTEVILGKDKSITDQIRALQLILNDNKMGEGEAKKIDLRFKNPVITF
ncbi:MAG: cell division protein FtsQ/DivIB [Patescibacteria group bacterium]|jgi:preprotein translocase subunit YajC